MGDDGQDHQPLRGDEADLFREHHDRLVRSVARTVTAPAVMVEDACQTTWAILLRRQPERGERLFGWLRTVAIREVWRLSRHQRREAWLEELRSEDGDWNEIFPADERLDDMIEARRALEIIASLPERQRDDLVLVFGGYSYHEIQQRTPGRTFTNVNKHIAKGRARVRRIEAPRAIGDQVANRSDHLTPARGEHSHPVPFDAGSPDRGVSAEAVSSPANGCRS